MEAKEIYFELFEAYRKRVKTKEQTWEAYKFSRHPAEELSVAAQNLADGTWNVKGYTPFKVYHPTRIINAPKYIDRIVEQWFVEKYLQPYVISKLHPYNMACQSGKGMHLAMDQIKAALSECYSMYGLDFWFFQFDIEKYFVNIAHDKAKEMLSGMSPDGYQIYKKVVDSFFIPSCYAAKASDLQNALVMQHCQLFGMPKGNLPSQWTGIVYLSDYDWILEREPCCIFNSRYMDDGISLHRNKADCIKAKHLLESYINDNSLGIRLHPQKTVYAPISRGFTFCGWRFSLDKDGTVHVRIKPSKKKEMEQKLFRVSEGVRKGSISHEKALVIREGIFHYLSHGTESARLIHYLRRRFPV